MSHKIQDVGAAKQIGKYSDAIETAAGLRWLHTSGTPGVADDGTVPEGIEAQTRLAWKYERGIGLRVARTMERV
jgi:2-iminobutanoate/2-iminopropanoate deaminase